MRPVFLPARYSYPSIPIPTAGVAHVNTQVRRVLRRVPHHQVCAAGRPAGNLVRLALTGIAHLHHYWRTTGHDAAQCRQPQR